MATGGTSRATAGATAGNHGVATSRATAGATGRPFLVKWMKGGAKGRAFAGSAERALVQITFADDDGASST